MNREEKRVADGRERKTHRRERERKKGDKKYRRMQYK